MNLTAVETALTTWVENYSGLPCEWGRQSQKAHAGPYVLAYLGAISKLGHDERIQTYDSATDTTSVRLVGVRRLVLRLSFRAFSQKLGASARQYAETLRIALASTSAMDELVAADLAYIDSDDLVDSDYIWSGRRVSQTDMSVSFALRASLSDADHDGSYIGSVNVSTQQYVIDEDGTPVVDEEGNLVVTEAEDAFSVPAS